MIEKDIIEKVKKFSLENKEYILNAQVVTPNADVSFFKVFDKNNENCIIYTDIIKNFMNELYEFCFKGKEKTIKSDFMGHCPEYNNKTLEELNELNFFNKDIFFKEMIFPVFMFMWGVAKEDPHRNREILTIHKHNIEKLIPTKVCSVCNKKILFDYDHKERKFTTSKLKAYEPCQSL